MRYDPFITVFSKHRYMTANTNSTKKISAKSINIELKFRTTNRNILFSVLIYKYLFLAVFFCTKIKQFLYRVNQRVLIQFIVSHFLFSPPIFQNIPHTYVNNQFPHLSIQNHIVSNTAL